MKYVGTRGGSTCIQHLTDSLVSMRMYVYTLYVVLGLYVCLYTFVCTVCLHSGHYVFTPSLVYMLVRKHSEASIIQHSLQSDHLMRYNRQILKYANSHSVIRQPDSLSSLSVGLERYHCCSLYSLGRITCCNYSTVDLSQPFLKPFEGQTGCMVSVDRWSLLRSMLDSLCGHMGWLTVPSIDRQALYTYIV